MTKEAIIDGLELYTVGRLKKDRVHITVEELQRFINEIKTLEQEPKTGHWIRVTDKSGHLVWECGKCSWQQRYNTNFCPDCGVKMVEPQERIMNDKGNI